MLGLGRKSGFGSYGPKFQLHGARVINISIDNDTGNMSLSTYIKQEDMSIDEQKKLHYPSKYSWLRKGHCMGAEEFTDLTQGILNIGTSATAWDWQ